MSERTLSLRISCCKLSFDFFGRGDGSFLKFSLLSFHVPLYTLSLHHLVFYFHLQNNLRVLFTLLVLRKFLLLLRCFLSSFLFFNQFRELQSFFVCLFLSLLTPCLDLFFFAFIFGSLEKRSSQKWPLLASSRLYTVIRRMFHKKGSSGRKSWTIRHYNDRCSLPIPLSSVIFQLNFPEHVCICHNSTRI